MSSLGNSNKLCECGCGELTHLVKLTDNRRGVVAGEPRRFLPGHHNKNRTTLLGRPWKEFEAEYFAYRAARNRCTNPNNKAWHDYGGRGIEFRFTSFEEFYKHIGPKPEGLTLDRIRNEGHYEIGNVRWATWSEQNLNKRPMNRRPHNKPMSAQGRKNIGDAHRGLKYKPRKVLV